MSLINKFNEQGYNIFSLEKHITELKRLKNIVEEKFNEALKANFKEENSEFFHFTSRPERGSLDLDILPEVEKSILGILKESDVLSFAKNYWEVDNLLYSTNFSKFRYVDPSLEKQLKYSPLHYDGAFMSGKSINICIPFTGYGREYPGLNIYKPLNGINFIRYFFGEGKAQRYLKLLGSKTEPFLEIGKCLCFNQDIYHNRSTTKKQKKRINLEFRIFPDDQKGLKQI